MNTISTALSSVLLKLPPFRQGIDLAPLRSSIRHERYERVEKIKECMALKEQNRILRETVVAQRIALDSVKAWNTEDVQALHEELSKTRAQLRAVCSERDRYLSALRRFFPGSTREAAV